MPLSRHSGKRQQFSSSQRIVFSISPIVHIVFVSRHATLRYKDTIRMQCLIDDCNKINTNLNIEQKNDETTTIHQQEMISSLFRHDVHRVGDNNGLLKNPPNIAYRSNCPIAHKN